MQADPKWVESLQTIGRFLKGKPPVRQEGERYKDFLNMLAKIYVVYSVVAPAIETLHAAALHPPPGLKTIAEGLELPVAAGILLSFISSDVRKVCWAPFFLRRPGGVRRSSYKLSSSPHEH